MNTDNTSQGRGGASDTPVPPIVAPPQIHSWETRPPLAAPNSAPSGGGERQLLTAGFVVISAVLVIFVTAIVGLTGFFRLSSPTAALRTSVMSAVPGPWDKTIALRVGWFTTGLVRTGARFFAMPPEPRAALEALHGAEVGVYKLQHEPASADFRTLFATADRAMKRRGWDRIVGVAENQQFVAVYFPHGKVSARGVKFCVVVFQGRELVVASASGNLEPLLKIAEEHIDLGDLKRCLPARGL
jgi:hypothetical protein